MPQCPYTALCLFWKGESTEHYVGAEFFVLLHTYLSLDRSVSSRLHKLNLTCICSSLTTTTHTLHRTHTFAHQPDTLHLTHTFS